MVQGIFGLWACGSASCTALENTDKWKLKGKTLGMILLSYEEKDQKVMIETQHPLPQHGLKMNAMHLDFDG